MVASEEDQEMINQIPEAAVQPSQVEDEEVKMQLMEEPDS